MTRICQTQSFVRLAEYQSTTRSIDGVARTRVQRVEHNKRVKCAADFFVKRLQTDSEFA